MNNEEIIKKGMEELDYQGVEKDRMENIFEKSCNLAREDERQKIIDYIKVFQFPNSIDGIHTKIRYEMMIKELTNQSQPTNPDRTDGIGSIHTDKRLLSSLDDTKQDKTADISKELDKIECDCVMFVGGSGKLCPDCRVEKERQKLAKEIFDKLDNCVASYKEYPGATQYIPLKEFQWYQKVKQKYLGVKE